MEIKRDNEMIIISYTIGGQEHHIELDQLINTAGDLLRTLQRITKEADCVEIKIKNEEE